jgi:hypothetical protein
MYRAFELYNDSTTVTFKVVLWHLSPYNQNSNLVHACFRGQFCTYDHSGSTIYQLLMVLSFVQQEIAELTISMLRILQQVFLI